MVVYGMAGQPVIGASIILKFYLHLAPTSTEYQPVFRERLIVLTEIIDIKDTNDESK